MNQQSPRMVRFSLWVGTALFLAGMVPHPKAIGGDDELQKAASWQRRSAEQIRELCHSWLRDAEIENPLRGRIETAIDHDKKLESSECLNVVTSIVAEIFPEVRSLVDQTKQPWDGTPIALASLDKKIPATAIAQVRLSVGRWMAQNEMYDEALGQFELITVEQVCDPVTLLFYRALSYHRLRMKEKCVRVLERLQENEAALPRRYEALTRLMAA